MKDLMHLEPRALRLGRCAAMFATLLSLAALHGCSRASSLPPLVDEPGASQIPGKFVWHNLITSDGEAARSFYGALFGWEFEVGKDGAMYASAQSLLGRLRFPDGAPLTIHDTWPRHRMRCGDRPRGPWPPRRASTSSRGR